MGVDALEYQDVRVSIEEYLEGVHEAAPSEFPLPVKVTWRLFADAYDPPHDHAILHITQVPGGASEGWIDRVDTIRLDCYAPGQDALGTLKSVTRLLVGENIETPNGLLDTVTVLSGRAPVEVEFQSETLNQATTILQIVHRPIN